MNRNWRSGEHAVWNAVMWKLALASFMRGPTSSKAYVDASRLWLEAFNRKMEAIAPVFEEVARRIGEWAEAYAEAVSSAASGSIPADGAGGDRASS